jgi:hypothetical protein
MNKLLLAISATFLLNSTMAQATVLITEVAPWGDLIINRSNITTYFTDWFELTNTGSSAVDITGWQMDDNSNGSEKVNLTGISSIAAGESVIFTEKAATADFLSTWFGSNVPVGLQVGNYTGQNVGLSVLFSDAVNIFDASGVLQANVVWVNADREAPYQTFDNAEGLNYATISLLSVVGTNGAFVALNALNNVNETGSPGRIGEPATPSAVPVPAALPLMASALVAFGISRRSKVKA